MSKVYGFKKVLRSCYLTPIQSSWLNVVIWFVSGIFHKICLILYKIGPKYNALFFSHYYDLKSKISCKKFIRIFIQNLRQSIYCPAPEVKHLVISFQPKQAIADIKTIFYFNFYVV